MGFKDLFIQKTETDNVAPKRIVHNPVSIMPPEDTINIDITDTTSILDIYANEGIADLSKSIFKVEEIKAVVPAELSSEVKKKTVLGMLSVSGLDVLSLSTDAQLRTTTLEAAYNAFNDKAADSISADEATITELEGKIDVLKQHINTVKKNQEAQNALINAEVNRINDILKFIE